MGKKEIKEKMDSTDKMIWACFMHLSFNFAGGIRNWGGLRDEFEPDMSTWDTAIDKMAAQGINMVLINLDDERLLGFMQTFWMPTTKKFEPTILKAIELMGAAKKEFYNK